TRSRSSYASWNPSSLSRRRRAEEVDVGDAHMRTVELGGIDSSPPRSRGRGSSQTNHWNGHLVSIYAGINPACSILILRLQIGIKMTSLPSVLISVSDAPDSVRAAHQAEAGVHDTDVAPG